MRNDGLKVVFCIMATFRGLISVSLSLIPKTIKRHSDIKHVAVHAVRPMRLNFRGKIPIFTFFFW